MSENTTLNEQLDGAQRGRRGGAAWGGVILIVLGITFLLQNLGVLGRDFNWWAIFILIPAIGSMGAAWAAFRRSGGRFNAIVRSSLSSGAIVLAVALMFLFGVNWAVWWPLMLIVPGLALLGNRFTDPESGTGRSLTALTGMGIWIGASVALLGLTFLLDNLDAINLRGLLGSFPWWGIFILIPGAGALLSAFLAYRQNDNRMNWTVQGLLVFGLVICVVAGLALLGWDWNLLTPIILIIAGLALLASFLLRRPINL